MRYDTCIATAKVVVKKKDLDFILDNDFAAYFLGVRQDFKHLGFTVSKLPSSIKTARLSHNLH